MKFEEYKKEIVGHFWKSVKLFSNRGKKERELWVVRKFLNVLGVYYNERELHQPKDEPPDIAFHDTRFEIMELYDEGRRRHNEYRDKLKKAEAAGNYAEIRQIENWDLESASLQELLSTAENRLQTKKGDYSPDTKSHLDILIYVNLKKMTIDEEDYVLTTPLPESSSLREWRSVSLVFNREVVCVAHALPDAPAFIRELAGKVIKK